LAWALAAGGAVGAVGGVDVVSVVSLAGAVGAVSVASPQPARAAEGGAWPVAHPLELSIYAGSWNFNQTIHFRDDALLGLRGGMGFVPWLQLELELDEITTSSRRDGAAARATSVAMHGRIEPWGHWRVSPGLVAGVSFMALEDDTDPDAIAEGLDVGVHARINVTPHVAVRPEIVGRYQSVRLVDDSQLRAAGATDAETRYLWSVGYRVGVGFAF
jgi:hypothetical protein